VGALTSSRVRKGFSSAKDYRFCVDWSLFAHFRAVARHDHLGHAADELGVTQPTLSRSIRILERFYGLPLFERYGRTVRLNANGRELLKHVERALGGLDDAQSAMRDRLNESEGQVALGFYGTLGSRTIPQAISMFRDAFPNVAVRLVQGAQPDLLARLVEGQLDFAITSAGAPDEIFGWEFLRDEELFVQVYADHRFAERVTLDLSELRDERLVVLRNGTALRAITDKLFASVDVTPNIVCEGQNIVTARGLVAVGLGIMLGPVPEGNSLDGVVAIPVTNPHCARPIGLSWLKQRYQSSAARRFREAVIVTESRRDLPEAATSRGAVRSRRPRD
jgi:DNA-binding transcriptional LysR family regulator